MVYVKAMILHIPHSSLNIPENLRDQFILSDEALRAELLLMTDLYTDELYDFPGAKPVIFPMSRLLVDVERFVDDNLEPMSKRGMGKIYTLTASGNKLKRNLSPKEIEDLIIEHYDKHHQALQAEVEAELEASGDALIVDCHSFPNHPLPYDMDQSVPRPDFCIGTDLVHTRLPLIETAVSFLKERGFTVGIDRPYAGTIVPLKFFQKNRRVISIMVEVNRSLYMDEASGKKSMGFETIKGHIRALLAAIESYPG